MSAGPKIIAALREAVAAFATLAIPSPTRTTPTSVPADTMALCRVRQNFVHCAHGDATPVALALATAQKR